MYVYMEITKDRYELPVAVADTMAELAKICGVHMTAISHAINGAKRTKYIRVEIEDYEEEEGIDEYHQNRSAV